MVREGQRKRVKKCKKNCIFFITTNIFAGELARNLAKVVKVVAVFESRNAKNQPHSCEADSRISLAARRTWLRVHLSKQSHPSD